MCGSMADIQSAAAEIRRGKKRRRRKKKKNKRQDENLMVCSIPLGGHNKDTKSPVASASCPVTFDICLVCTLYSCGRGRKA